MRIWFDKELNVEKIKDIGNGTMSEHIGMEWEEVGDDFISATMPVDNRTRQPYGLLHGGASCALAETIGSLAAAMVVDRERFACVGIEINANHVRSATDGRVRGVAKPLHLGSSTQVWDIRIYNETKQLICVSRLTVAVIPKKASFRQSSL